MCYKFFATSKCENIPKTAKMNKTDDIVIFISSK